MKIDPQLVAAQKKNQLSHGQPQAGRWLADLEQAFLDAWDRDAQAGARAPAAAAPRELHGSSVPQGAADREASPAESTPQDEGRAGFQGAQRHAADNAPSGSPNTQLAAPSALSLVGGSMGSAGATAGDPSAFFGVGITSAAGEQRQALLMDMASIAPLFLAEQASPTPTTSADDRTQRTTALHYGKSLFHLAVGDQVQATIRDARLTGEQPQQVAQAVAKQLRSEGVAVRRVYVNGQVFEISTSNHPEE